MIIEFDDNDLDDDSRFSMEEFQKSQPRERTDFGSLQIKHPEELRVGSIYKLVNGFAGFEFLIQVMELGGKSFSYHAVNPMTSRLSPLKISRYADYSLKPYKCGTWNSVNYIEQLLLN